MTETVKRRMRENKFVFQCKEYGEVVCLFTNNGQLYTVKVQDLPFGKFRDKGIPIDNVSNFNSSQEELLLVTSQSELNLYRVIFTTRMGMIKVVDGGEFDVAKRTVAATKLQEGDEVVSVIMMKEQKNVIFAALKTVISSALVWMKSLKRKKPQSASAA